VIGNPATGNSDLIFTLSSSVPFCNNRTVHRFITNNKLIKVKGKSERSELSEILYNNLKQLNNNKKNKSETSYVCVLLHLWYIYSNSQYDQIEDEMGEACSKHGKMRNEYKISKPEGKRPHGVDGKML
jgi:hypothetical protein